MRCRNKRSLLAGAVSRCRCWRCESANVSGSASVSTTQKSFRDIQQSHAYPEDSGYEIGYTVELAKGLPGSVTSRIFYIYFTILGVKKIVRYIENQKREAQNQKSAQRLLQSHDSEQRVLFFHNNISASHTSLVRSGLQMLLNLCRNHNII